MTKPVFLILASVFLFSCVKADGEWAELFNGHSLDGWEIINGHAPYQVEDGVISGTSVMGSPNTFLVTREKYTNFVLEYEVKMDQGLNSGVQIRSNSFPEFHNGRVHGPQVECEDSPRDWAGGIYDEARQGWRYTLESNPAAKNTFKKGEWNHFRVVAFGNHIMTWVNGVATANLVEEKVESGFIGLQVHSINREELAGKQIRWKNIRIKVLDEQLFKQYGKSEAPEISYLNNALTPAEEASGWKLLWDGTTTQGWRGARLDHFPRDGWSMEAGVLKVHATGGGESTAGGDIVTVDKYRNFILEVDFRITQGANSGIKYFVDTELNQGEGSSIGCEFQILDDRYHPDAKMGVNGNRTMASLYDLIRANGKQFNPHLPTEKYVNGYDYWNRARVVVDGNRVQHYLNGIKVIDYERNTQMWDALVQFSKYHVWPGFGTFEQGHILLQDHGDEVFFRNIKIKEL